MKLAESHPDMWVILSLDIAAGVENYCTKIEKKAHLKCLLSTKSSGIITKNLNRWINIAVSDEIPKPCFPGDFSSYELPY